MKKRIFLFLLIIGIFLGSSYICSARSYKATIILYKAKRLIENKNYKKAIKLLSRYANKNTSNTDHLLFFVLGTCYNETNQPKKAIDCYKKCLKIKRVQKSYQQ